MQGHHFINTHASLQIKNMVSTSCVRIVKEDLERTGFIKVVQIKLGEVEILFEPL